MKPLSQLELALLSSEYVEYLHDFDPTPEHAYDGYKNPMSFDEFVEENAK